MMAERARHQGRYKRTAAQEWRAEAAPEDTAPSEPAPAIPDVSTWSVSPAEAKAALKQQMCPVCGEGPWKSPLNHAARKHGIDRFTMRDICGLILKDKVTDPELSERIAERGKARDMTAIGTRGEGSRRKYRHTSTGLARVASNLQGVSDETRRENARASKTPEARRMQADSLRAWFAEHPEAKDAARARLRRSSEDLSRQSREAWARRGLQPCGTVAAYKRGCRCDDCRAAKRASR